MWCCSDHGMDVDEYREGSSRYERKDKTRLVKFDYFAGVNRGAMAEGGSGGSTPFVKKYESFLWRLDLPITSIC